jgi:hypothetical protein
MDQTIEKPSALFPTRISSRAIIGGTLVALAVNLVIMIFGGAIGISGHPRAVPFGPATEIGYGICFILALCLGAFIGGWTAAASSRSSEPRDGILHALITWAAIVIANSFFMTGLYARTALYLVGGRVEISKVAAEIGLWGTFIAFVLTVACAIGGGLLGVMGERRASSPERRRVPQERPPKTTLPATPQPSF